MLTQHNHVRKHSHHRSIINNRTFNFRIFFHCMHNASIIPTYMTIYNKIFAPARSICSVLQQYRTLTKCSPEWWCVEYFKNATSDHMKAVENNTNGSSSQNVPWSSFLTQTCVTAFSNWVICLCVLLRKPMLTMCVTIHTRVSYAIHINKTDICEHENNEIEVCVHFTAPICRIVDDKFVWW